MNDKEENSFRLIYNFYQKWRDTIIETDEQWADFATEVGAMGVLLDIDHNPLGWHLMNAVLDTFNDLYKDGAKPMPANYFGRDDFEH